MRCARSARFVLVVGLGVASALPAPAQSPKWRYVHGGVVEGLFVLPSDNRLVWTSEDGSRTRKSSDGGDTWAPSNGVPDHVRGNLRGAFFLNEDDGWQCGSGGVVLATTNGGDDWTDLTQSNPVLDSLDPDGSGSLPCGQPAELYDIFMIDATNGWVVGLDGTLRVTTNNWTTWSTPASLPAELGCGSDPELIADVYDVHFFADTAPNQFQRGVIAADLGYVFITNDGGVNWTKNNVPARIFDLTCTPTPCSQPACPDIGTGNLEFWTQSFDNPLDSSSAGWHCGGVGTNQGYVFRLNSVTWASRLGSWTQTRCYDAWVDSDLPLVCGIPTQYGIASLSSTDAMSGGYADGLWRYEGGTPDSFNPCNSPCGSGGTNPCGPTIWVEKEPQGYETFAPKPPVYDVAKVSSVLTTTEAIIAGRFGVLRRYDPTEPNSDPNCENGFCDEGTTTFLRLGDGAAILPASGDPTVIVVIGQGNVIKRSTNTGAS